MTCFPAKLGLSVSFVKKEWQIKLEAYNADCMLALLLPGAGAGSEYVGICHGAADTNRKFTFFFPLAEHWMIRSLIDVTIIGF